MFAFRGENVLFGPYRSVAVVSISSSYDRGVSFSAKRVETHGWRIPISKDPEVVVAAISFDLTRVVCHGRLVKYVSSLVVGASLF